MTTPPKAFQTSDALWKGVVVLAVAHAVAALVALLAAEGLSEEGAWFSFVIGIGVLQILYGLPLGLWLRHSGRRRSALGVWLGMGITLLVNGGCWGYFFLTWGAH